MDHPTSYDYNHHYLMQNKYHNELFDNARGPYNDQNACDACLYGLEHEASQSRVASRRDFDGEYEGEIDEDLTERLKNDIAVLGHQSLDDLRDQHCIGEHFDDEERYAVTMAGMSRAFGGMEEQCSCYGSHLSYFHSPYSSIPCPDYIQYYPNLFAGASIPRYTPHYGQEHLHAPQPHLVHYSPLLWHAPQHNGDPRMHAPQHYDEYDQQSPLRYDIDSNQEDFLDEGFIGFRYDEEDYNAPSSRHQYNQTPPSPPVGVHQYDPRKLGGARSLYAPMTR